MTQLLKTTGVLLAVLSLSACDTLETYVSDITGSGSKLRAAQTAGPKLAPAPLPRYRPGSVYAFDDGRKETVLRADGEWVRWRKNRHTTAVTYRNFLIPTMSWETRRRLSRASVTASSRALWPLRVGNRVRFDVTQVVEAKGTHKLRGGQTRRTYRHSWDCAVERTERVTVPAGTFDTFKITCSRYRPGTDVWRQTRVFHYAPRLGHFIARADTYARGEKRRIQLTSISRTRPGR